MVRERTAGDLAACVAGLRAVHLADGYPRNWPADPAGWLSPPRLSRAWVAELPEPGAAELPEPGAAELPGVRAAGVAGLAGVGLAGHVAVQGDGEVSRLFVVPGARRRGVARALLRRAVDWGRGNGLPLTLNVTEEQRSPAIAFYEATGWRYTHTSVADWTGPTGEPVRLLHYRFEGS